MAAAVMEAVKALVVEAPVVVVAMAVRMAERTVVVRVAGYSEMGKQEARMAATVAEAMAAVAGEVMAVGRGVDA